MVQSEIAVRSARLDDLHRLAHNDYAFVVDSMAAGPFTGPALTEFQVIPPYIKKYDFATTALAQYIGNSESALFLAVDADDTPVGHLAISRSWNGYGSVDDFAVDVRARRLGCASRMMDAAVGWTKERGLPGLRLETQHNNAAACRFYQTYGFRLGGYDAHLYDALLPESAPKEIALFWYFHFGHGAEHRSRTR